jgi:hypothetical protein
MAYYGISSLKEFDGKSNLPEVMEHLKMSVELGNRLECLLMEFIKRRIHWKAKLSKHNGIFENINRFRKFLLKWLITKLI